MAKPPRISKLFWILPSHWPNMTDAERDQAWVKICEEIEKAVKNYGQWPDRHYPMPRDIEFTIVPGDITSFGADVIALKYARISYGADKKVRLLLDSAGQGSTALTPAVGKHVLVKTGNTTGQLSTTKRYDFIHRYNANYHSHRPCKIAR